MDILRRFKMEKLVCSCGSFNFIEEKKHIFVKHVVTDIIKKE